MDTPPILHCYFLFFCRFLVSNGANTDLKDRFGNKPLDDAKREGHEKIATLLTFKRGGISLKDKNPGLVALGSSDGRTIETERVLRALEEVGIPRSDQRVSDALKEFPKVRNNEQTDCTANLPFDFLPFAIDGWHSACVVSQV